MALPPWDPGELRRRASNIVAGTIRSVRTSTVEQGGEYVDERWQASVEVERVEKGSGIEVGSTAVAESWQPCRRPRDWLGPWGIGPPAEGTRARVFPHRGENGSLHVIEPNGIESFTPEPHSPLLRRRVY